MSQNGEIEWNRFSLSEVPFEQDDDESVHINGEITALLTPEPSSKSEHQVVALLPLIRKPNHSLSRLYRFGIFSTLCIFFVLEPAPQQLQGRHLSELATIMIYLFLKELRKTIHYWVRLFEILIAKTF
jgi:hypothetical protein